MTREWALGDVHDTVSSAVPERDMIVWGSGKADYRWARLTSEHATEAV